MRVAVVGAGVMGLASARAIAQRGEDVTVYEQFELGHTRGSSHGASRIFRLSYLEDKWIELAQRAYVLWHELERETGAQLIKLNGLIDAEADPAARVAAFERHGVAYELLDPDEIARRFNMAYDRPLVFSPDAGISLAAEAQRAFESSARAAARRSRAARAHREPGRRRGRRRRRDRRGWAPRLLAGAGIELPATPTRESTAAYFALPDDRVASRP